MLTSVSRTVTPTLVFLPLAGGARVVQGVVVLVACMVSAGEEARSGAEPARLTRVDTASNSTRVDEAHTLRSVACAFRGHRSLFLSEEVA